MLRIRKARWWLAVLALAMGSSLFPIEQEVPLFYWSPEGEALENFGDYLSLKLIEKVVHQHVNFTCNVCSQQPKKLLAVGSILHFANTGDVVWGAGINGKHLDPKDYRFTNLDIRAVRGPLTRKFLIEHFSIPCPEIYGDPALLLPEFFPQFHKKEKPSRKYLVIPHISEEHLFPKNGKHPVVYPTDSWEHVVEEILDSELVISSSLHGIIVAEAFGIPARMLNITNNEPLFKYEDYYLGTGRANFKPARSVKEAVRLGGEPPIELNLKPLLDAFPVDLWEQKQIEAQ